MSSLLLVTGGVACGEDEGPEAAPVVAADGAPTGDVPATEVSSDQALRTDAEMYAAMFGTTVDEGERRLIAQSQAGQLSQLEQQFPDTYGTSGVVQTPDFGFFVTTTDVEGMRSAAPREIGGYPVEVREVSHSRADLHAALARFTTAAGLEDGAYDVAIDAATTEITFYVADDDVADELEEAARSAGSPVDGDQGRFLLPDGVPVRIERTDGLAEPTSADP